MTVKTRETLMQRAMNGRPIMGQDLRDLIDTMFWLKASPEQRAAQVVRQIVSGAPAPAPEFPSVTGTGFVKIGADGKWFTDQTVYLTKREGDSYYFRNSQFPKDPTVYLDGTGKFQNFVDSARIAFTGGDGIDIVDGDISVDDTVSRVGHIHDDRYYTETEMDAKLFNKDDKHRFPVNSDGTYNVVPSYSNANRQITLTPTGSSFDVWIQGTKYTFTGAQVLPQHSNTSGKYFYYLDENGVFQVSTTPYELLKVAPVATVLWDSAKGEARWIHELHTTEMSPLTHQRLHEKGSVIRTGGFAISGYTLDTTSQAAVNFGVAGGLLFDEDVKHTIPAMADGGPYEIWYRTGASGDWTWDSVAAPGYPYKSGTTYFTVNQFTGGAWSQVEINSGGVPSYGNIFVVITPNNGGVPIVIVQGQNVYTDVNLAIQESWDALDKGYFPFMEYFPIYRLTYKASVAYSGVTGRVQLTRVTSVATGTESGVSGATVHNSLSGRDAADAHPALAITDIAALANGSLLKKISTGVVAATAADLPLHASRHHFDGVDPLAGQSIAGLLTTSVPTFAGEILKAAASQADLTFQSSAGVRTFAIRWNGLADQVEVFSANDDGSPRTSRMFIPRSSSSPVSIRLGLTVTGTTTLDTGLTGILKATAGVVSVAGAADLPNHASRHQWDGADPIQGQQLLGLRAHETPTFGGIRGGSVIGYLPFLENNGTEIMRLMSTGMLVHQNISLDGDLRIGNLTGILYAQNGTVRVAIGSDLPSHTHFTSQVTEDTNLWFTDQRARDAITGNSPISVVNGVVSHIDTDGNRHVPANGLSNSGKFLVSSGTPGSYSWSDIPAGSLPNHASRHHFGGADPLVGQSIAGLLTTSVPTFAGEILKAGTSQADLTFQSSAGVRTFAIRWNGLADQVEVFSANDDGSPRTDRILIPRSSSSPVSIRLGLTVTGTTTLDTGLTGMLKATAGVVSVAGASDLPSHASRHQWDGADPIAGQQLNGLRSTDSVTFAGFTANGIAQFNSDVNFQGTLKQFGQIRIDSGGSGYFTSVGVLNIGTNVIAKANSFGVLVGSSLSDTGLAVSSSVKMQLLAGLDITGTTTLDTGLTGMLKATAGVVSVAGASDLPLHASRHHAGGADALVGQSIAGLRTTDSPEFLRVYIGSELRMKDTTTGIQAWGLTSNSSGLELAARNSDWSAIDWPLTIQHPAGGVIRLGGTTNRPVNLTYTLQMGGVEVLTSARGGRLSDLVVTGQTTLATSLTGMLKATAGVVSVAGAADLPNHASRHHAGGADQLDGPSIFGLQPFSTPEFAGLKLGSLNGILAATSGTIGASSRFTYSASQSLVNAPAYSGVNGVAALLAGSSYIAAVRDASSSWADIGGTLFLSDYAGSNSGVLKTISTGEVVIAGELDLPGGPYLPLAGGKRVSGWVAFDAAVYPTEEVLFSGYSLGQLGMTLNTAFSVNGDLQFTIYSPTNINNVVSFESKGDFKFRSIKSSEGTTLPVLGNEQVVMLVGDSGPFEWETNSTQDVSYFNGTDTTVVNAGGNQIGIASLGKCMILVGPTSNSSERCSLFIV